jgi:hypothetical protein
MGKCLEVAINKYKLAQLKDELGFDYVEESKSPQLSH